MTRYVFNEPDAMFHWIDRVALKLLSIPREQFGKIEININRTDGGKTWGFIIDPDEKEKWKKRFEDEKK